MLGHIRMRVTENGLRVFQAEFLPDIVCVRVSHLMWHPSLNPRLFAGAGNRTAERSPCDLEQLRVRIG